MAAISRLDILDDETVEALGYNGATEISNTDAKVIAAALRRALRRKDRAWSQQPDDGTFRKKPQDAHLTNGPTREALAHVTAF